MTNLDGPCRSRRNLCSVCGKPLRRRRNASHDRCVPCWRLAQRGPRLTELLRNFERIVELGPSLLRCAIALQVSESTISNWRKGKTDPSAENVLRLRQLCAEHRYLIINAL
jgi:hypothetical protein